MAVPPGSAHGQRSGTDVLNASRVLRYQGPYRPPILSVPLVTLVNGNGPAVLVLQAGILGGDLIVIAQAVNNTGGTAAATPTAPGMTFSPIGSVVGGSDTVYAWQALAAGTYRTASPDAGKAVSVATIGNAPGRFSALAVVLDGTLVNQATPVVPGSFTSQGFTASANARIMPAHAMSQAGRVFAIASDLGAPCSQSAVPGVGYTNLGDTAITAM
jgi:hypothetical protein